jgi:hypothetical protein
MGVPGGDGGETPLGGPPVVTGVRPRRRRRIPATIAATTTTVAMIPHVKAEGDEGEPELPVPDPPPPPAEVTVIDTVWVACWWLTESVTVRVARYVPAVA